MKTIQGLAAAILVSTLALSGCATTADYNKRTESDSPEQTESAGPVASEPNDPDLIHWTGVAVKQIGECLDRVGTIDYFDYVAFDDDPAVFGALYVYFKDGKYGTVVLLAREFADGSRDFVQPWTDWDKEALDSVHCYD